MLLGTQYAPIIALWESVDGQELGLTAQGDRSSEFAALLALYQTERQEASAYDTLHFTMLALAMTYAGATIALLDDELATSVGAAVILVTPVPLWLAGIYFLMLSGAASIRSEAAVYLESRIVQLAALDGVDHPEFGLGATSRVRSLRIASGSVRVALVICYAGMGFLLFLYTIYMIGGADAQPHGWWFWPVAVVAYGSLLTVVITSTVSALRLLPKRSNC